MKFKILLVMICFTNTLFSAPKSTLWAYWNKSDKNNNTVIEHSLWAEFLNNNVKSIGELNLISYEEVSNEDFNILNRYIQELEGLNITEYNKVEQLAYWINLYNALTVKVVLDNYPVKSIREIKPSGFLVIGPWDMKYLNIQGQNISLNDIEHRILRPIWEDKRIHFVINCASIGCPKLLKVPITSTGLDELLTHAEYDFLNSFNGARINDDTIILSSIFNWFKVDFANSDDDLIEYISSINPSINKGIKKIKYKYNWNLNTY